MCNKTYCINIVAFIIVITFILVIKSSISIIQSVIFFTTYQISLQAFTIKTRYLSNFLKCLFCIYLSLIYICIISQIDEYCRPKAATSSELKRET